MRSYQMKSKSEMSAMIEFDETPPLRIACAPAVTADGVAVVLDGMLDGMLEGRLEDMLEDITLPRLVVGEVVVRELPPLLVSEEVRDVEVEIDSSLLLLLALLLLPVLELELLTLELSVELLLSEDVEVLLAERLEEDELSEELEEVDDDVDEEKIG